MYNVTPQKNVDRWHMWLFKFLKKESFHIKIINFYSLFFISVTTLQPTTCMYPTSFLFTLFAFFFLFSFLHVTDISHPPLHSTSWTKFISKTNKKKQQKDTTLLLFPRPSKVVKVLLQKKNSIHDKSN